jgi:hypothetical protein
MVERGNREKGNETQYGEEHDDALGRSFLRGRASAHSTFQQARIVSGDVDRREP